MRHRAASRSGRAGVGRWFAAVVGCALLLGACGDDDAADGSDDASGSAPTADGLDGRTFVSTSVEGATLVDDSEISLSFESSGVSAIAGCNTLFGDYELDGNTLVVESPAQTNMACEDALMDQDVWLTHLLTGRPTITVEGEVLTLSSADVTVAFEEGEPAT